MATDVRHDPITIEADGYEILTRSVPLRPIKSTEGHHAAIARLDALSDRRATMTTGEMDYFVVLALIVEQYEGIIYPTPPES